MANKQHFCTHYKITGNTKYKGRLEDGWVKVSLDDRLCTVSYAKRVMSETDDGKCRSCVWLQSA